MFGEPGWRSKGDLRHILFVSEKTVRGKNHRNTFKTSVLIISAHIPVANTYHVTKSKVSETEIQPWEGGRRREERLKGTDQYCNPSHQPGLFSHLPTTPGVLDSSELDSANCTFHSPHSAWLPAQPKQHYVSVLTCGRCGEGARVDSHPELSPAASRQGTWYHSKFQSWDLKHKNSENILKAACRNMQRTSLTLQGRFL